jgi:ABC-2 type transport system permease protein
VRPLRRFRPLPLAASRIAGFWLEVWKCWRLTLDWTVQLYIALPALFVGANMYRDAWQHPPEWFAIVTPQTVFALLGAWMLRARLRTFADPGDGLFLRRNRRWTTKLLAVGFAYTWLARLLLSAAAAGLLVPVLDIRLHWTFGTGASLVAASSLLGYVWALVRDRVERRRSGWSRIAVSWLIRAGLMAAWIASMTAALHRPALLVAVFALLLGASIALTWRRALARGTFMQEVAAEDEAYVACVRILLQNSVGIRNKPAFRKPVFSLAGRNVFRKREMPQRIAELWLKAGLREGENIRLLIMLTLLGMAALLLSPLPLAVVLWPVLGLLVLFWLHGQWRQWEQERFVSMLPWPPGAPGLAEPLARSFFFLPMFGLWGLALGLKAALMYGGAWWIAVPAAVAAGWALGNLLNGGMTAFLKSRSRKRRAGGQDNRERSERPV